MIKQIIAVIVTARTDLGALCGMKRRRAITGEVVGGQNEVPIVGAV